MSRLRNLLLFLGLAAVWGSAFAAIETGLAFFPPVLFAAVRYDIAGVAMLGYALLVVEDPLPRTRADWATVGVAGLLLIAAYHAFLFVGQTDPAVTSAAAAVVVSLSPVLTTGFSRLLLPDERVTPTGLLGLAVGLAGAVVLANPEPENLLAGGVLAKGLVVLAVVSFSLGSVLTRRLEADIELPAMEAWGMLLGAGLLHVVSVGIGERAGAVVWSPAALAALAYLAVVASALGFLVYFELLERLGPVEINLVSYVAPVFAALTGWALLAETPTAATVAGFCLVVVGFLLLKHEAIREEIRFARGTSRHEE